MPYAKQTQDSFEAALRYFDALRKKGSASTIEQKTLFLLSQHFLEYQARWDACSEIDYKIYREYVRSTPLWDMLVLPREKWAAWIDANLMA